MGAFFVYIIKATVCLSVFYLFYRLLLSRETFHRFNRIAALGILLLSLLIPFCEITIEKQNEVQQTVLSLEQLLMLADLTENFSEISPVQEPKAVWIQFILLFYWCGVVFFIFRNLYSLGRLCVLLRSGECQRLEDEKNNRKYKLIIHDKEKISPFSWMGYIAISRKDLEESGREILIHEMAHIRKCHSIDLLIADICILFQWFNPAAWLLKQELQTIHEYEADEMVINEGVNAKQYQLLLIKKAVGTRLYSMANSFNHSKLKKRITMMLKKKSNPWARLKYLYILPVAAIAVSAFARPEVSNELKEISEFKVNDLATIVVANEEKKQPDKLQPESDQNKKKERKSEDKKSENKEKQQNTQTEDRPVVRTVSVVEINTNEPDSVKQGRFMAITLDDDKVGVTKEMRFFDQSNRMFTTKKIKVHTISADKEPLVIVNGKESTYKDLQGLDTRRIKSIDVLKDHAATGIYGDKAVNGVILVTLLNEGEAIERQGQETSAKKIIRLAKNDFPAGVMFVLDGNELSNIDVLDPNKISVINVFTPQNKRDKNAAALFEKFGDKAKNGIVSIVSKKAGEKEGMTVIVDFKDLIEEPSDKLENE